MWLGSRQFAKYIIGFFMAIGKCFSVIVKSINSDSVLDPNLIIERVVGKSQWIWLGLIQIKNVNKKIEIYAKIESLNPFSLRVHIS